MLLFLVPLQKRGHGLALFQMWERLSLTLQFF